MADKADFVQQIYAAGLAAGLTDAAARVMAAQAGIESGYGDRAPGNNYFAITKGADWNGPTIARVDKDSKGNPITQQFRSYTSAAAGLADRVAYMDVHFPGFNDAPTVPDALKVLQNGTFGKYYEAPQAKYEASVNGIIKKYVPALPTPKVTPIPPLDVPATGNLKIVDVTKGGAVKGGAVPANPFADRQRTGKIEGVVMHHSGGSSLTGAMLAGQGEGKQHGTSAQYYIDTDGTIYRYSPDSTAAIDIREPGGKFRTDQGRPSYVLGNQTSIGIEIVGLDSTKFTPAQKQAAAALAAQLQQTYKFDPSMIVGHGDIQGGPGGNKQPDEGVEVAAFARTALEQNDALRAIDTVSPRDQATVMMGYTVGQSATSRMAAMTAGVTARQRLYDSAAAGVRRAPGTAAMVVPPMTPNQNYDGGTMRSAAPTSDEEFFRLLTPAPDNFDPVGDGPASWFTKAPDVAPGGVGSVALVGSGAALHGVEAAPVPRDRSTALGLVEPGNIDVQHRQVYFGADGTYGTEQSFSIGTDKGEVLIPQIVNGRKLSQQEAIDHYQATGENLGTFKDAAAADAYATQLHMRNQGLGDMPVPMPGRPAALGAYAQLAAVAAADAAPVPMPGRPTFPVTAPVPMPGRPAALSTVGATVSSDRPLTGLDVHKATAAQIIHVGKHDYEVGQTFDQGGFHYVVTADGIQKRRLQTGEKTIVSGIIGGIAKEGATKAVTAVGETLPGAGKAIEAGADTLHQKLNSGTDSVTRSLAGGVVSIGDFFKSFTPAPAPTPSWQVSIQRALLPATKPSPPAAITPQSVAPKYAPLASPTSVPKKVEQSPPAAAAAPPPKAQPIQTSGSSVDARGGDIPQTKAHAPQIAPIYTSPIKSVPSTKATTRVETRDVPNPDYAAWEKNQPASAALSGKLQDIHDSRDAGVMAAQRSTATVAPPPQTIRVSRAVPVSGGVAAPGGSGGPNPLAAAAGVGRGVSLERVVRNGEIVVQPQQSSRSASASQAARAATVTLASGKTNVAVGTMGTAQGGRYVYQVQADGSVKELNSGKTTAPPPSLSNNGGGNGIGTTWDKSSGSWVGGGA